MWILRVTIVSSCYRAGLHSEQAALVDFLVLARCRAFVGFGVSTFSYFLPQYKALRNFPAASSAFVGGITKTYETYGNLLDVLEEPVVIKTMRTWTIQDFLGCKY